MKGCDPLQMLTSVYNIVLFYVFKCNYNNVIVLYKREIQK